MRERATLEREIDVLLGRRPVAGTVAPLREVATEADREAPGWDQWEGREFETPTPADRAIFAAIATQIAADQTKTRGDNVPGLRRIEALANAVLAENVEKSRLETKALLDGFGKGGLPSNTESILGPVASELVARTYVLGLKNESKALLNYFASRDYLPFGSRAEPSRTSWAFDIIADHIRRRPAPTDGATARARAERVARVFDALSRDFVGPHTGRPNAISREATLTALLELIFAALDVMVRSATRELETGASSSAASLTSARQTIVTVMNAVLPRYEGVPLSIEVTRNVLTPKPRHVDYFDPARGASVPIRSYSQLKPTFADKSLRLNRVFEARLEQLDALKTIFAEAARLKVKLSLHDNESWRAFALTVVKAARAAGRTPADALTSAGDFLSQYFRAFTIHTLVNIDDFGTIPVATAVKENYLQREFPRAATGQRIHDCGVYTVRAAYILSGAREALGSSARALLFPNHVALVVTIGTLAKRDQLANARVMLVNNDLVEHFKDLPGVAKQWADTRPYDETKFVAALAASRYLSGVPLPFRFVPVPALPSSLSAATRRATLWQWYLTKISTRPVPLNRDVLKPTPAIQEPWLEYLDLFEHMRRNSNDGEVPFWRQATILWNGMNQKGWLALVKSLLQPRQGAAGRAKFDKAVAPVWRDYWKLSQDWRETMEGVADGQARLRTFLVNHPAALEQGASVTEGADDLAGTTLHQVGFWLYMGDLPAKTERLQKDAAVALKRAQGLGKSTLLTGRDVEPPWAKLRPPEPMD